MKTLEERLNELKEEGYKVEGSREGNWSDIEDEHTICQVKHFQEPSKFGLANSRISKMVCGTKGGESSPVSLAGAQFNFDRGLDFIDIREREKELTRLIGNVWDKLG